MTIEQSNNPLSLLKRFINANPNAWQPCKWAFLGLAVTAIVVFSGAIPLAGLMTAELAAVTFMVSAIVVALGAAALWYGAFKPASLWLANRFFYPKYAEQKIMAPAPQEDKKPDSTNCLMRLFGFGASSRSYRRAQPEEPHQGENIFTTPKNTSNPLIPAEEGHLQFSS